MPPAPVDSVITAKPVLDRTRAQKSLAQRIYGFRVLGMGLASLPMVVVMLELDSPWLAWIWTAFGCLLWPHVAYGLARRSRDPFRAELRNLMFDSVFAGSCVPMLHFNVLPSAMLLTVVTADKVNSGIRRLWLHAMPGTLLAMLGMAMLTGFAWQPRTSMSVMLACLPIMVIHTLAVSMSSYRLVRRVQMQNIELEELSRVDALTGLESRRHWEDQAEQLLRSYNAGTASASVMLLDVDQFKAINDRYGHAVGDDVLRGIADLIRRMMPAESHSGRLGGDEFAVVLPATRVQALAAAERVRKAVEIIENSNAPDMRCSISIGIAEPPARDLGLREWIEAADRALYRAKHAGRNRTMVTDRTG